MLATFTISAASNKMAMRLLFHGPNQRESYIHVTAVTFVLVPLYVDVLSVTLDKYKEVFLNATQQV